MIEIRNLFHEGGSPADLRYKEEERKRPWEIAEKTAHKECTLDWSQSKVFLVNHKYAHGAPKLLLNRGPLHPCYATGYFASRYAPLSKNLATPLALDYRANGQTVY